MPRLLGGPPSGAGPENLAAHVARLGGRPRPAATLVDELESAGLRGRGGAAFPTARKWRAVAERSTGDAVVLVNGAETEPMSGKDHLLLTTRPHLVIDGLGLAAGVVGARRAVIYVAGAAADAQRVLSAAIAERRAAGVADPPISIVRAPLRYIAGEETAAVSVVNGGPPRPTLVPPRPSERGVDGRPTLVQNVETLAHVALIARHGAEWHRSLGSSEAPGSMLVSVSGSIHEAGVYEMAGGSTVAQVVNRAGGAVGSVAAVLVGGYFGRWVPAGDAWDLRLGVDVPMGSGVVAVFPHSSCGVNQAAAIMSFLARESARQCRPCQHGLAALAATMAELAAGTARPRDTDRLERWIGQVAGRGACHHPDGALVMLGSALRTFAGDVASHLRRRRCDRDPIPLLPAPDWTGRR
ncbi:MAG: NADH-ubiquinone oxidoreductase-F iron-sulfur binding region domain-containing protein [Candidatus Dormibacteria bacterium]